MPEINRRILLSTFSLAFTELVTSVSAGIRNPYFQSEIIDLTELLVPPPNSGSEQSNFELSELRLLQSSVSEHRKQQALLDSEEGFMPFVSTTRLGQLASSDLPNSVALIQRVLDTQDAITSPAKKFFNRPRPTSVDMEIQSFVKTPDSYAYPSGHATGGTAIAILLSSMIPTYRGELMQRAADYATSRLIVGVHYRSDIASGFTAGALLARTLMGNAGFKRDFATSRMELIDALRG